MKTIAHAKKNRIKISKKNLQLKGIYTYIEAPASQINRHLQTNISCKLQ